ncbi:Type III restriction enzyme, res subunit family protein [Brugia malayi]|uniref:Type III restriction enzyme, res subunit family protein n=2 Tax=Brugia malayi TaxID=6279 RepID=A0A4E9F154_BRUMA|nr:Type III restriction enzyme, res subunit family protein [Brugia malayi]VIO90383.1 Type III restriction enzyme, res subunit family protein [Brugia malayi]
MQYLRIAIVNAMLPEQELRLLYLYDDEIMKRIALHHVEAVKFALLLKPNEYETLTEQYQFNWNAFSVKLWERLWEAPTRTLLLETVLSFLLSCDQKLHRRLLRINFRSNLLDLIEVLKNFDEIFKNMKPDIMCEKISCISRHHANLMMPVKNIIEQMGEESAKKYILRTMLDMGEGAFLDLLNAVAACSDVAHHFVTETYPGFERNYRLFLHERKRMERGKLYFCECDFPIADVIMSSRSNELDKTCIVDLRYEHFPVNASDAAKDDIYEGEVMVLRKYQEEIAQPAYDGQNTLICAPTGTGKTVVAASIARNHLVMGRKNNLHTKICFFVTNVVFLEQQTKLLKRFVGHRWKVVFLCGVAANTPVAETIATHDVIVITPQLIVNLMNDSNEKNSVLFSLSSFSLMFFDEAHHADGNHPYNVIMNNYHDMKHTGKILDGKRLPQIVGLTASLGIGSAQNASEAVEHFIKICANLDITVLSYVRENIDELRAFSSIAADETKLVPFNIKTDSIVIGILNLFKRFEIFLSKIVRSASMSDKIHDNSNQDLLHKLLNPPHDKCSKVYETWFSQLLVGFVPLAKLDRVIRFHLMTCLQLIGILFRSLDYYIHFPSCVAKKYFENEFSFIRHTADQELVDIMETCPLKTVTGDNADNELYNELLRELRDQFARLGDGRAIVFVSTRYFAGKLAEELNKDESLHMLNAKSDFITGINASGEFGGQSANQQRNALVRFTSGRGRAANSRCVLITNDAKLQAREEKNINREQIMRNALKLINQKPPDWFQDEVAERVKQNIMERTRKKLLLDEKKIVLTSNRYTLLCKKCDAVICNSNEIVVTPTYSQYICVCKEIWNRSIQRAFSKATIEREADFLFKGIGAMNCVKCWHHWGRIVHYNNFTLPIIAATAFVLVAENGERFQRKRWKQIVESLFRPRNIEIYDYANMKTAMPDLSDLIIDDSCI